MTLHVAAGSVRRLAKTLGVKGSPVALTGKELSNRGRTMLLQPLLARVCCDRFPNRSAGTLMGDIGTCIDGAPLVLFEFIIKIGRYLAHHPSLFKNISQEAHHNGSARNPILTSAWGHGWWGLLT